MLSALVLPVCPHNEWQQTVFLCVLDSCFWYLYCASVHIVLGSKQWPCVFFICVFDTFVFISWCLCCLSVYTVTKLALCLGCLWCLRFVMLMDSKLAVQVQTLLLAPICPHTCDHVWRDKLQQPGTVLTAGWPKAPQPKAALQVCLSIPFGLAHCCLSKIAFHCLCSALFNCLFFLA